MLTRRIVDQILPADSIADAEARSPARQSTLTWRGLAVVLLVACILGEAALLRVGIDDLDEGYFVQQTARVLHGQIPYRDFETLYSPGLVYAHAVLIGGLSGFVGGGALASVSSVWLLAPRMLAMVCRAGLALLLYGMARPLVRNAWWAAAPGALLLLGLDDAPVRWEPHPGWPSTLFAVLAAWCLSHPPSRRWLALSGVFAAAAYVFKQNTGLLILAAVVFVTMPVSARATGSAVAAFASATALWLVPLVMALNGDVTRLGVLVGAVNTVGLVASPDAAVIVPLACLVGGLWLLRGGPDSRIKLYLLTGTALFLTELPRPDTVHLAWSAPLLLVVGAVALDRVPSRVVRGAAVLATLALCAPTLIDRVTYLTEPTVPIAGVQAPSQTAADLEGVIEEVQQRTRPGQPIFVYPSSPLLYVLADRRNPTRFDHLNPGAANSHQIEQLIQDLNAANVNVVVISEFWRGKWGPPGANQGLEGWLSETYVDVARHGAYRVLIAGPGPRPKTSSGETGPRPD